MILRPAFFVVVCGTFCSTEQCSEDLKGKVAWQKRDLLGSELAKERQRSQSPGDPTLESEMAKAVQESRVLKAVVVPLEEVHVCIILYIYKESINALHVTSVSFVSRR